MELYQIRHFIAVVEAGGFTKGAQRAGVSQPAISASIARLEAELEVKLLDRAQSPVVPTAAGARLLESGKEILHTCNAVKAELKAIAMPKVLRIGILQSLSSCHVSKLLSSFRRATPHGAIEVFDGSNEQLIELLEERQLDAVLTILDGGVSIFASRVLFPSNGKSGLLLTVDGSVGYQILRQFVMTFDYSRRELWFEHSPAFGTKTVQ